MKGGFIVGCKKYKKIEGQLKEKIKKEYLTTDTTYEKLAKENGVSYDSLTTVGAKEKWFKHKQELSEKLATKYIEHISNELIKERGKVVDTTIEGFKKAAEKAKGIIENSENIYEINKAVKTLETIADKLGIKPTLDLKLQEAQIRKIEAETEYTNSRAKDTNSDVDDGITFNITFPS